MLKLALNWVISPLINSHHNTTRDPRLNLSKKRSSPFLLLANQHNKLLKINCREGPPLELIISMSRSHGPPAPHTMAKVLRMNFTCCVSYHTRYDYYSKIPSSLYSTNTAAYYCVPILNKSLPQPSTTYAQSQHTIIYIIANWSTAFNVPSRGRRVVDTAAKCVPMEMQTLFMNGFVLLLWRIQLQFHSTISIELLFLSILHFPLWMGTRSQVRHSLNIITTASLLTFYMHRH